MDFLGLLGGSGLARSDSPYGLIGHDDVLELFGGEVEENVLYLLLHHIEMLASLPLFEILAYAEDDAQTACEGEPDLHDQLFIGFAVILTALGMTEDCPFAANALEHVYGDLSGVGALFVVGAVLCGKFYPGALYSLGHGGQMGEGRSHDKAYVFGKFGRFCGDCLREFNSFGNGGVHLPVPGYDFFTHIYVF